MTNSEKSFNESFAKCIKLAEQGDAEAQFLVGKVYFWGYRIKKNRRKAVKWWIKAAELGHADAQHWLGICCECGFGGLKQDFAVAIDWWRKAIANGNTGALMKIVSFYLFNDNGGGKTLISKEEALKCCQQAALSGNSLAKHFLKNEYWWK